MMSRYDALCMAIERLFECENTEAVHILKSTRTGRLVNSANKSVMFETLTNNIEAVIDELKSNEFYKEKCDRISNIDICSTANGINKIIYEKKKQYRKNILKNGYHKTPESSKTISSYYTRMCLNNKKKLINICYSNIVDKIVE